MFKKVGNLENTAVYESNLFRKGHGITIPQIGIITYSGAYSRQSDLPLIKHEYGHILQNKKYGSFIFYLKIGFPSLFSAIKSSIFKNYHHKYHKVEIEANLLSYQYFNHPSDWNFKDFPIKHNS